MLSVTNGIVPTVEVLLEWHFGGVTIVTAALDSPFRGRRCF
jgi:hypothetical protein